jgi:ubiquinone/menaquinone biosynthesis C-methylase UbiE
MEKISMSEANKRAYDTPGGPESYARHTTLLKAEEFIFSYLSEAIKDKAILDIGVGAGRTVPYLRGLSNDYTGIDYSENMLKYCRVKYSDAKLLLCDARNMDVFEDRVFDVVFCGWNAIDDADHGDRTRMLREIYRVLRKNGLFVFSAHNLDCKRRSPYKFRGFVPARNRVESIKQNAIRVKRYFMGILNHLHNKRREVHEKEYSIINDPSHSFRLLTHYTRKENQVRQLEDMGFSEVEMIDEKGCLISIGQDCRDGWIYYICRKPG